MGLMGEDDAPAVTRASEILTRLEIRHSSGATRRPWRVDLDPAELVAFAELVDGADWPKRVELARERVYDETEGF